MFWTAIIWLALAFARPGYGEPASQIETVLNLHAVSQDTILLGPYTGTLEDPHRTIRPQQEPSQTFTFTPSVIKHFSYTASRIWTRIEVVNPDSTPLQRILEVDLPGMDAFHFHRVTLGNGEAEGPTPESRLERKIMYHNPFLRLSIPAHAHEVWYIGFDNYYAMTIKILLHTPEAFEEQSDWEAVLFSSYMGFIVFAACFSFFLYYQTRHVPFVLYGFLLLSFHFFFFLSNFGVLTPIWQKWPWFEKRAIFVSIELSQIFGFYFFYSLSEFKKYLPRLYRWTLLFPIKSFLVLLISLFYFDVTLVKASVASVAVILPFFIGFGTYLSLQGQRPAFFFVIGWGVALVSNTVYAVTLSINLSDIPALFSSFLGHRLPLLANIIEAIFMAMAIGDQFKQYRAQAQMEKENLIRLQKDLDDAEAVQAAFFTKRQIPPTLSLWAEARSAERTGGDWYGYYFDPDGRRFYMAIVDVTGHGVPSALVTGAVHGTFYSLVPVLNREERTPGARLQRLAESLNRIVHDTGHHADLVATMALVEIDLASHRVYYTNMGHCPAILISKNKAHMVHAMGSLLGLHENIVIKVKEYQAEPSDILLFYTDGWLENCKPGEKPLSFKRFLSCLEPCASLDDLSLALQAIREKQRITAPEDDSTAIAIQFQAA